MFIRLWFTRWIRVLLKTVQRHQKGRINYLERLWTRNQARNATQNTHGKIIAVEAIGTKGNICLVDQTTSGGTNGLETDHSPPRVPNNTGIINTKMSHRMRQHRHTSQPPTAFISLSLLSLQLPDQTVRKLGRRTLSLEVPPRWSEKRRASIHTVPNSTGTLISALTYQRPMHRFHTPVALKCPGFNFRAESPSTHARKAETTKPPAIMTDCHVSLLAGMLRTSPAGPCVDISAR